MCIPICLEKRRHIYIIILIVLVFLHALNMLVYMIRYVTDETVDMEHLRSTSKCQLSKFTICNAVLAWYIPYTVCNRWNGWHGTSNFYFDYVTTRINATDERIRMEYGIQIVGARVLVFFFMISYDETVGTAHARHINVHIYSNDMIICVYVCILSYEWNGRHGTSNITIINMYY